MRDDPTVVALITRARAGDKNAWDQIVDRYAPLVWSISMRFGLGRADAEDVAQSVWLTLVERLTTLREPAALPGWLVTTTRRECLRHVEKAERRARVLQGAGTEVLVGTEDAVIEGELFEAERNAALVAGLRQLDPRCRRLLVLLMQHPPVPYTTISATLDMSVGTIGPARARCLDKLRRCPSVAALMRSERHDGR